MFSIVDKYKKKPVVIFVGIIIMGVVFIGDFGTGINTLKSCYSSIFENEQTTAIVSKQTTVIVSEQTTPVKEPSKDEQNDVFLTLSSYMGIYYSETMTELEINETLALYNGKKVVWEGLVKYINMSKDVLGEKSYIIGFYPESSIKPTIQLHFPVCELPESFKGVVRTLKIGQKIRCTGTIISRLRVLASDIKGV